MAPAAINKEIPPSIGIQGGGQQPGLPPGGFGGGIDMQIAANPIVNKKRNKNFELIIICFGNVNI